MSDEHSQKMAERIQSFQADAELSRESMSKVLGVSSMSLKRWNDGYAITPWVYNAVERKLDLFDKEQRDNKLLLHLHGLKQREKVERLIGVLYNNLIRR